MHEQFAHESLTITRATGYTLLKRVHGIWDKLYDVQGINPKLDAKNLSHVLKVVGSNSRAQDFIFKALSEKDKELVYDLSTVLTQSSINFAEFGYNKDKIHVLQINIALFCSLETGLPTMIRTIPGSVRDIESLYNSIIEVNTEGEQSYWIEVSFPKMQLNSCWKRMGALFCLPEEIAAFYETGIELNNHLFYHKRLIKCEKTN